MQKRNIRELIKEINESFKSQKDYKNFQEVQVIDNKNYKDMVHIKYCGVDICAGPQEIYDEANPNYTNEFGDTHPYEEIIRTKINMFLDKWYNDPEFKSLMTDPL